MLFSVTAVLAFVASACAQSTAPLDITIVKPFANTAFKTGDNVTITWTVNNPQPSGTTLDLYWEVYPGGNTLVGQRFGSIAPKVDITLLQYTATIPTSLATGYYAIQAMLGSKDFYSPLITVSKDPNVTLPPPGQSQTVTAKTTTSPAPASSTSAAPKPSGTTSAPAPTTSAPSSAGIVGASVGVAALSVALSLFL
ncbi:hypothetical protein HDU97_000736 [Phlyctochytrium planicorne]|nr:hypothetical protein HDU97_000736 [Phlyctochytrium planicorne]